MLLTAVVHVVEVKNGTSWTAPAIASLVVAATALTLSAIAFFRSVRWPKIVARRVKRRSTDFRAGGVRDNGIPGGNSVVLTLALSNTGSRGTVLETLRVLDLTIESKRPLLGGILGGSAGRAAGANAELPQALQAGTTELYEVNANIAFSNDLGEPVDVEEFARRLRGLTKARVVVEWTYLRPSLRPWLSRPIVVKKKQTIELDPTDYVNSVVSQWPVRGHQSLAELANSFK